VVTSQILLNGDFESNYNGWLPSGNQSIGSSGEPPTNHVNFNGQDLAPNGVLTQAFPTKPGLRYELRFDAGIVAFNSFTQHLRVTVTGESTLLSQVVTQTGTGSGNSYWTPHEFTFVADSTMATLTFRDESTSTNSIDVLLANVHVGAISPSSTPTISGTPGNITLRITAAEAGSYVLERSADLAVWDRIDEITVNAPGPVVFHDSQTPALPHAATFYRIGRSP
jgi:hypothetical protein